MKISIIIPVYNVADYLRKCVDSAIKQKFDDYEVILVDDGSTDGICPALCDKLQAANPEKIRVIHQENKGLGGARNTGIEASRGEYLLFVDSDDYISEYTLKELNRYIERYHADVYDFGFYVCKEGEKPTPQIDNIPKDAVLRAKDHPALMEANPTAWTRLWKRSLFIDYQIQYPSRVWYEDIRTTEKLFVCADSIVSIPQCFYYYLVRENSITHNKNVARNREIIDAFDDLIAWFKENGYYHQYYEELCRLAVEHIFVVGSVRVLRIDDKSPLLKEFADYMKNNFPDYKKNKRLDSMNRNQKMVLGLLNRKQYHLVRRMFEIKDRIS